VKETREEVKSLPQEEMIENVLQEKRIMERNRASEIARFKSQIKESQAEIDKLTNQLDQSTARSEELQDENMRLIAELDEIETAIRSVRSDYTQLRDQIDQNGPLVPYEHVRLRTGQMEERRRELLQKREAELQGKLDSAISHRDYLNEELRRRLEIMRN
jgi:aminoglycoside phosphotransferase family enzyme